MDDRRLTDFLDDEADEAGDGESDADRSDVGTDGASGDGGDADDPVESGADVDTGAVDAVAADVEPAAVTFAWSPESGDCAVCGGSVARRWRRETDSGRVCADCKEW